jgi:hypothetical protein
MLPELATSLALLASGSACESPSAIQKLAFSAVKYPHIRSHHRHATRQLGYPTVLRINRPGADTRRRRLMATQPPAPAGMDRDEYPPAMARRTWKASVRPVPSSENRSHGATLGNLTRPYCDGTRVRYVFR